MCLCSCNFAGPRSEQTDPVGNSTVWYFDRVGNVTTTVDALGHQTVRAYDGLKRLTSVTFPEGNQLSYTYDQLNNMLTRTAIAKPGSTLANIVNTFTYDSVYNKVHTAKDGRNNTTTYNYDPATGNLLNIRVRPVLPVVAPVVAMVV